MRIERINENSIRCTLTNFDLSVRNVNLSELTYGSEKARNLFREMMQRASHEVGFDAEDIPIMVEAIPMANDSIMLIITKIDDPEELDTRFSRFSQGEEDEIPSGTSFANELLEGAEGLLNLLSDPAALLESLSQADNNQKTDQRLEKAVLSPTVSKNHAAETDSAAADSAPNVRIYQFGSLDLVCSAAKETGHIFTGESILYKNPANGKFYLLLKKESCDEFAFSKICNRLSEYAARQKYDPAAEAYFAEHYDLFVKKQALQVLANL